MIDWKKSRSLPEWLTWTGIFLFVMLVGGNFGLQRDLMRLWDGFILTVLHFIVHPVNSVLQAQVYAESNPLAAIFLSYIVVSHTVFWYISRQ